MGFFWVSILLDFGRFVVLIRREGVQFGGSGTKSLNFGGFFLGSFIAFVGSVRLGGCLLLLLVQDSQASCLLDWEGFFITIDRNCVEFGGFGMEKC